MARHVWSVLCYKLAIAEPTKTVSLLDAVEKMTVSLEVLDRKHGTGYIEAPMTLVSMFIRDDPGKPESPEALRYDICAPNGDVVGHAELNTDLQKSQRCRLWVNFRRIPWYGEGFYSIKVMQRASGEEEFAEVADIPWELVVVKPEEQPSESPD